LVRANSQAEVNPSRIASADEPSAKASVVAHNCQPLMASTRDSFPDQHGLEARSGTIRLSWIR